MESSSLFLVDLDSCSKPPEIGFLARLNSDQVGKKG